MRTALFWVFGILLIAPCLSHGSEDNTLESIDQIQSPTELIHTSPDRLAEKMILKRDFRFIGIGEFSVQVPGIDSESCKADPDRVFTLPGTSDQLTKQQRELQSKAKIVARRYNLIIRRHLVEANTLDAWLRCKESRQR